LVERALWERGVAGSSPVIPTMRHVVLSRVQLPAAAFQSDLPETVYGRSGFYIHKFHIRGKGT